MGYLKDQVRARVASRAELQALQRKVKTLQQQLGGAGPADLPRLRKRVARMAERLGAQGEKLREQRREVRRLTSQLDMLKTDFTRMASQLAATETRIEWLRERADPEVLDATPQEQAEARRLIEEVRREHAQIKVRFQVVSNYEERLSRVEAALAEDRSRPVS